MRKEELEVVHEAINRHGDSFWNDPSEGNEIGNASWNGYLFDEVVDMLEKDGYELKLVKKEVQKKLDSVTEFEKWREEN